MSAEALAVVEAFCELAMPGDAAAISDLLDPDVILRGTRGGLYERRVGRGPQAVLDYLAEIQDLWERFDAEVERLIDAGDSVVVFWRETGRARHGGLEVENETAAIFKVENGQIVEITGYLDRDEALRAARLADR